MHREGASVEIEVKLRFPSIEEARSRLEKLAADIRETRRFEDNLVYDTPEGRLARAGSLLRLREVEGKGVLTLKEVVASDLRAKVRSELQTEVRSPGAIREIFSKIGLVEVYRYQKHRSYYAWSDPQTGETLEISLDETPIGVFVELEGSKPSIDRAARRMGFGESDYILEDYRSLHRLWLEERQLAPSDMLFEEPRNTGKQG